MNLFFSYPKKAVLSFVLLFAAFAGAAQSSTPELTNLQWHIIPSFSNSGNSLLLAQTEPYKQSAGNVEASKIKISETETIVLVGYEKGAYGIVSINNKGKVNWSTRLTGIPVKIAKLGDAIVVITNADYKLLSGFSNDYSAVLVNAATGKIMRTKKLSNITLNKKLPLFFTSSKGRFFYIGTRSDKSSDGQLTILLLNAQLETSKKATLNINAASSLFRYTNDDEGNFYASGYQDENTLVVTYFSSTGERKGMLSTSISRNKKTAYNCDLFAGNTPGKVYATVDYYNDDKDKTYGLFIADFTKNKMAANHITLDKNLVKLKKAAYQPINKDLDKLHEKDWDRLTTMAVLEHNNKVLVWREGYDVAVNYMPNDSRSRADRFMTSDAWCTIYSDEAKEISTTIIPKYAELFAPMAYGSSLQIKEQNLHFVTADLQKQTNTAVLGTLNLNTGKLSKYELLVKQTDPKKFIAEPKSTLWFSDGYLLNYLNDHGGFTIKHITTDLQKVNY